MRVYLLLATLLFLLSAPSAEAGVGRAHRAKGAVKAQWTCHATGFGVIAMVQFFQATASTRDEAERRVLNECSGAFVCHYAECYKH